MLCLNIKSEYVVSLKLFIYIKKINNMEFNCRNAWLKSSHGWKTTLKKNWSRLTFIQMSTWYINIYIFLLYFGPKVTIIALRIQNGEWRFIFLMQSSIFQVSKLLTNNVQHQKSIGIIQNVIRANKDHYKN